MTEGSGHKEAAKEPLQPVMQDLLLNYSSGTEDEFGYDISDGFHPGTRQADLCPVTGTSVKREISKTEGTK